MKGWQFRVNRSCQGIPFDFAYFDTKWGARLYIRWSQFLGFEVDVHGEPWA